MNYELLEKELKKRIEIPYYWGGKQFDKLDNQTNFIYKIDSFASILSEIEVNFKNNNQYNNLRNYTLNRWYNFRSAKAVEAIFCEHENVKPHIDSYNKFTDFFINNTPFDHKTTVFPNGFKKSVPYAIEHKGELIEWSYKNQSQQQRKHFKNRLFVVLVNYENDNEHWKLKAEISWLREIIVAYLRNFNSSKLYSFKNENKVVKADIIWAIK